MSQEFRLEDGGRVNRDETVNFTYNGQKLQGYAGDTLASALLANGIHLVGRGFKYHRPRGIVSAGHEEPNALVDLNVEKDQDSFREANVRAPIVELREGLSAESVNAFPSVKRDVGAVNQLMSRFFPAGFYYKTFMGPIASFWTNLYEPVIRKAAGLGKSSKTQDTDRYEFQYGHCDVLIAGGGPAGLAAALAAASGKARVILVDEGPELGGSLLADPADIDGMAADSWIAQTKAALEANPNVRIMSRSSVVSWWDHNFLNVWERCTDHLPLGTAEPTQARQKLHRIRAKQVVLAQGAFERPMLFNNNDRPGTMLASAARTYVTRYGVRLGDAGLFYTNNDAAYADALAMVQAGQELAAVVDLREVADGPNTDAFRATGIPIYANSVIADVKGSQRVKGALVSALTADGKALADEGQVIDCDFIAMAGGITPNVQLHSQSAAKLKWDEDLGAFIPATPSKVNPSISVGACNGTLGLADVLAEGFAAGSAAATAAGQKASGTAPSAENQAVGSHRWLWLPPGKKNYDKGGKFFVDYQNDVKIDDLALAQRENFVSVEHTKRYTTLGMATDQGKTSNINALGALSQITGKDVPQIGTTTFRPPYVPTTFMTYVGREIDDFFDLTRTTPMHSWHVDNGAAFEPVGQWDRAWYYPKAGEDMHAAVQRESKAVRDAVGMLDASTLGKISVVGPDAGEFLNRMYTNAWKKLPVGKCRYGLMLNEAGMIVDDGVTSRISENEYHMTTTTGGAASVLGTLEEYLQTEWPDLKVYLTSVTEQWAVAALNGPNARKVLQELTDEDISAETLPFMGWKEVDLGGIPARIFRISFTGDLAFEVNVPADYGLQLWQMLMTAGKSYGITPYGTETMHLLRAEKGFIIVGQETDGSMTPMDLGLGGMVSKKKGDFIGRRSLTRPDIIKDDRKQLVGLETVDPNVVLPEGSQLVFEANMPDAKDLPAHRPAKTVVKMAGFVASSYYSPNCERSIAMALVKGGHALMGTKVHSPQTDGSVIEAVIRDTNFFDPTGDRQRG